LDVRILTVAGLALTFFGLFLVFGSTILYLSGNQELIGMLGPIGPGMPPVFFIMVVVGAVATPRPSLMPVKHRLRVKKPLSRKPLRSPRQRLC